MSPKWYQKLTPTEVWNEYVGNSVELFISFFHIETKPITDIKKMCRRYAKDICISLCKPYTLEQLDHFTELLEKYINDYIDEIGGYDKLKLYTKEEVEAIEDKTNEDLLKTIEWYKNLKGY
jgi:phosphomevalonate kinase